MPRGPVLQPLELSEQEIAQLTAWSRHPKRARALAERAAIILASASGAPATTVAAAVGVTRQTVGKWRARFLSRRLDGLVDAPRPGTSRTIRDCDVERVIRKTLEERPRDATHWSTRAMARGRSRSFGNGAVNGAPGPGAIELLTGDAESAALAGDCGPSWRSAKARGPAGFSRSARSRCQPARRPAQSERQPRVISPGAGPARWTPRPGARRRASTPRARRTAAPSTLRRRPRTTRRASASRPRGRRRRW